jgi:hypothetical protein
MMNMKPFNKYKIIGACFLATSLLGSGCKKYLNINQNPNFPTLTQGTPSLVFPVAVLATTAKVGGDLEILGGFWSEHITQAALSQQYTEADSYNIQNTDVFSQSPWAILFTDALKNYQYVIDQADTLKDWNFYLLGTVMKAYTTEVLVDLYDQIPYSQAVLGANQLNPPFEGGESIYQSLLSEIDNALSKDFKASTVTAPGTQDLIYGGNMTSWKIFANTLKLKMYLRMINKDPARANAGITALLSSGAPFISSASGGASVTNFTDAPGLDNPLYEQNIRQLNTQVNLRASNTFVSWLHANSDPRINDFFGPNPVTGINQGDFRNISPAYTSASVFVETPKDPVDFISVAESYFLQAEADFRYNGGANAQSLYEQGVTAAFAALGEDASSFIAPGGAYAWGAETEGGVTLTPIQQIIRQKWASCAHGCHGIESYFERNRTGFPLQSPVYSNDPAYVPGQIVVSATSVLPPGQLPKRVVFPYDETSRNTKSPAPVPETTPVWWSL